MGTQISTAKAFSAKISHIPRRESTVVEEVENIDEGKFTQCLLDGTQN